MIAKRFSKCTETSDEVSTTCILKDMSRCLSVPDATTLHLFLSSKCNSIPAS